jgi:hypothetical protein
VAAVTTSSDLPSHGPSIRVARDGHVATVTIALAVAYVERRPPTFTVQ